MPARDAEATLADQLGALAGQSFVGDWELVVVDNNSRDSTVAIAGAWGIRLPNLTIHHATSGTGVAYVRNVGAAAAGGEFICFCDADDVVDPDWLSALVRSSPYFDVVGGRLEVHRLNSANSVGWRGEIPPHELMRPLDWLPFAPGGHCGIWRDVINRLNGWDDSYRGGSDDVDFSWRAQLAGYAVGYAPDSVLHYRYREDLRSAMRQNRTFGRTEALLYARFRGRGIPRVRLRRVIKVWLRLLLGCPSLLAGTSARGRWLCQLLYRWGRFEGACARRIIFG